jgi:hypothetical protein
MGGIAVVIVGLLAVCFVVVGAAVGTQDVDVVVFGKAREDI